MNLMTDALRGAATLQKQAEALRKSVCCNKILQYNLLAFAHSLPEDVLLCAWLGSSVMASAHLRRCWHD